MALQQVKKKSFTLKKEATDWAKNEKKKAGPSADLKWETNRTKNEDRPWEAVLFREV